MSERMRPPVDPTPAEHELPSAPGTVPVSPGFPSCSPPPTPAAETPLIDLRNISKSYPDGDRRVDVLTHLDFLLFPGEFVTVTGQSGSGKSTLLRLITLIDSQFSGQYLLSGKEINKIRGKEREVLRLSHFAYVPQKSNLIEAYSVLDNTALPLLYRRINKKESLARARRALHEVGLDGLEKRRPHRLSGGQQQRVAIARALATEARLLVCDEPTGNLDPHTGKEIMELFRRLNEQGTTVLMVTHDQEWSRCGHRCLQLRDGMLH